MSDSSSSEDGTPPLYYLPEADAVANEMTVKDLGRLLKLAGFSTGVVARLSEADEKADARYDGWVLFYEYPFRVGHLFPFTRLVQDVLAGWEFSPCQIMPYDWRLLQILDRMNERYPDLGFSFEALEYGYYPTTLRSNQFCFRTRPGCKALAIKLDANDRGWRKRFFFVQIASLGLGEEFSFLRTQWSLKEFDNEDRPPNPSLAAKWEKLLGLSKSHRHFDNSTSTSPLPSDAMAAAPSASKSTSTFVIRSSARLSFKDLMASKGKNKAGSSQLPPSAPKVTRSKRKEVEIIDVDDRPKKRASVEDAGPLAIFILDNIELAKMPVNLEEALGNVWMAYQHLRLAQAKALSIQSEA